MINPLFAIGGIKDFWFAVPLILAVSLVYAATRHEDMGPILGHAAGSASGSSASSAQFFALLLFVSWLDS